MKKYLVAFVLAIILGIATISLVSAAPGLQRGGNIHYVTFGETLYSIAAQYGVTVDDILRYNGLTNPDLIYVGQPLGIPGGFNNPTNYYAPSNTFGSNAFGCANAHTVVAGETLSGIAFSYGVTLQEMLNYNDLYNSNMVYVGQRVCLPPGVQRGYVPQTASFQQGYNLPQTGYYHTVGAGETVGTIADLYGVNYLDIIQSNNLNSDGFIRIGERLYIPGYQPAPAASYSAPAPAHDYGYNGNPPLPAYAAPPPAPSYQEYAVEPAASSSGNVPDAPEFQPEAALPLLPEADHPIEVVVNGGSTWVPDVIQPFDDPNGITTLIINTVEKDVQRMVRARSGDIELHGELGLVPEFGVDRFRLAFRYISPGDYDVWIDDPDMPSDKAHVKVEPGRRVEVAFRKGVSFSGPTFASPDGWVLAAWDNPSRPHENVGGWSNILVHTPASGLWVNIESEGGGYKAKCVTGAKGPGSCDFAGLMAGLYWINIDGTDLTLKTYMDGNAYATFTFARQPSSKDDNSIGPVSYP